MCLGVCLSVCSLLRYFLNVFLHPLPEIGCPKFSEKEVVPDLKTFAHKGFMNFFEKHKQRKEWQIRVEVKRGSWKRKKNLQRKYGNYKKK